MVDKKKAVLFLKSTNGNVDGRNGSGIPYMKKIMPDKESKKYKP